LPYYYPAKLGCRDVASDFRIVNRVAEGTYGIVYRGEEKKNGKFKYLFDVVRNNFC